MSLPPAGGAGRRFLAGAAVGFGLGLAVADVEAGLWLAPVLALYAGVPATAWYRGAGRLTRAMLGIPAGFVAGYALAMGLWLAFGTSRPSSSGGDAMGMIFFVAPLAGILLAVVAAFWMGRRRAVPAG